MLEQISALVKEYGQQPVIDNPDIPEQENNAVLAEATSTITGGMQNMLAGGGLQDIISMFTGGKTDSNDNSGGGGVSSLLKNPAVMMIIGQLISKLTSKFNMSPQQASNVSNQLVPNVLNGLITRTTSNDPENDSFDFNDLIGTLTGGKTATAESAGGGFDFQGLLNQLTGNGGSNSNNEKNGGFDLQDIISQVTQQAQEGQEKQTKKEEGGMGDLIKNLFN